MPSSKSKQYVKIKIINNYDYNMNEIQPIKFLDLVIWNFDDDSISYDFSRLDFSPFFQ